MVVAALIVALSIGSVNAAVLGRCDLRLSVQLTPDVPDPRDPGFLNSLVADPLFHVTWVKSIDSGVVVDLTGPGPAYRCKDAMAQLSKDTHVVEIHVVQSSK